MIRGQSSTMDIRIHRVDSPNIFQKHLDPCECADEETIETTTEELEAFYTVRAILRPVVDCRRVTMRDCIRECKVLLDGDLYRPICKFNFHQPEKSIVLYSSDGAELIPVRSGNDLYEYAEVLRSVVAWYEREQPAKARLLEDEIMA
jgi:hypothetical protein